MKHSAGVLLLITGLASPAVAQTQAVVQRAAEGPAPQAISGAATSGRHCISGNAANIHSLGWVVSGTSYSVRINTDVELVTAIVRLDLSASSATVTTGSPEFSNTAGSSGTMALHVASRAGGAGCYSYQVSIAVPAGTASIGDGAGLHDEQAGGAVQISRDSFAPLAISGTPSSAQFCISGTGVANVHEIGRVDQASRVTVSFDADFNAVAGITGTILSAGANADGRFATDDNSGGGSNPALSYSARAGDNVALFVGGVNGAVGCYRYKVEIQ